jgi:hypothetical protein
LVLAFVVSFFGRLEAGATLSIFLMIVGQARQLIQGSYSAKGSAIIVSWKSSCLKGVELTECGLLPIIVPKPRFLGGGKKIIELTPRVSRQAELTITPYDNVGN